MEALLGSKLVSKAGEVDTATVKDAEVIGLYFSAHWCGPCRGFTPMLVEQYKKMREVEGKKFEVVFVSSDKDEASFGEYYGEMPWLALPFADRERKGKLSSKFKVNGIPSLILVRGNGELITTGGRSAIMNTADWPFVPPTAADILSKSGLVTGKGEAVPLPSAAPPGSFLALYFSAHWCPPCRGFTPKLAAAYKKVKAGGAKLEVAFVSSDRDKEGFDEYFAEMPWLAVPFEDRDAKAKLSALFEVRGIPTLILLDDKLRLVNPDARGAVEAGRDFPWLPPEVLDLEEEGDSINEAPALLVLMEKAEGAWDDVDKTLTELSRAQRAAGGDGEGDLLFFVAKEIGGGVTDQVRKLFKLGAAGKKAQAVVTDFPAGGKFCVLEGDVTPESLRKAAQDFKEGKITFKSLGDDE